MIILTGDHRYIDTDTGREYPSVTATIRDAGVMGWVTEDAYYAERGKEVHKTTALWDKWLLDEDSVDPQIVPYLDAWKAYRCNVPTKPDCIEEIVSDLVVGYCGTIDRDGLDIKTGAPAKWHILQAAAYWHARPYRQVGWTSVYLQDDGKYKLIIYKPSELQAAFKVFCAALQINQWKRENRLYGDGCEPNE